MHGYRNAADKANKFVHNARMTHWTDQLHGLLLKISADFNRPDVDAQFLDAVGVKLDRALFPLLSRIGVLGPTGTVDLADAVGRDHSTISRQVAKLEQLGLVERVASASDRRVRLLQPTAQGQAMVPKFAQTRRRLMEAHFKDWDPGQRDALIRLLEKAIGG